MSEPELAIIYDLHSHTTASDGLLTPEQLVHRAVEMGIHTLAITDHDTTTGLPAAHQEIERAGLALRLIDGVEISTLWENHEIHIVGLGIDITHPEMVAFLNGQAQRRMQRAEMIAERLEKARIPGALEGARRLADGGVVTRGHFARFLIEDGRATNMANVFKHYLARGKTGYVPPQWCTIEQAIDVIHHSGGQAVIAHPGRYQLSAKWLKRLLNQFAAAGGDAMEVAQCQQAPNERNQLASYAGQFGLLASQGSDFHQPCPWIELGRRLRLPEGLTPVWHRWPPELSKERAV
ncbi:PHP domain-containing protein [Cronobacter universalis]|uniref:5'-3' exoribonuclease Rnm n=1 Tax=Cronobacter universalis NCTC 9529 TaxID=1074000 RepID=A0AAC8VQN6_9ENTR|nr:PHP domain-containing protein [Cronobacter universalis]ALB55186.1 S-adenosylmethionine tRNA ribosyltransferase [Cronobacter universalis NCTC 9529]ELY7390200.1 PHP domain-containing protein [Cronobacter universalis]CCK14682.1 COG0613, Predicted metal-dependent phosphoesterases (PHP family) [Cronobacter universalis NCTC 9529]STD09253.1 Histidinol phosphatase and related hydrolases of the PHP family [Cronobacter universalis NCTC 9529]